MKKTILFAVCVMLVSSLVTAQTPTSATKAPLCEECSKYPFKPIGCDHTNCLEQLLSTITKKELYEYFSLPTNIIDKVIYTRNRGVSSMNDYKNALEPSEYATLLRAYDHYVLLRTPK